MPYSKDDFNDWWNHREVDGTPGGVTHYILFRGDGEETAVCLRPIKKSNGTAFCSNPAGKGTWHPGTGACSKHGGNAGRKPTTARHAKVARSRLAADVERYVTEDRDKLFDLTKELATVKLLFEEFVDHFPEPGAENYGIELHRIQALIGTIGTLVDKISKIESRNTLTAAQVLYLRACVADLLVKYVPVEDRERAVEELLHRVGGHQAMMLEG